MWHCYLALRFLLTAGAFVFLCFPAHVQATLHHECFVFGEDSKGSIVVRNDWGWRSSSFFYESQDVWKTDIPIFTTEEHFLSPNWGQKFGKCTLDLYSVGLCSKDELFVVHDLWTGSSLKADNNNRFILARSNYTYRVETNSPTVICVMVFQNPKLGPKERRIETFAKGTFYSKSLRYGQFWLPFIMQLLLIAVLWLFIFPVAPAGGVVDFFSSAATIYASTSFILAGLKFIQLCSQVFIHLCLPSQAPSSVMSRLLTNDDSVLSLFLSPVILLYTLLTMIVHISILNTTARLPTTDIKQSYRLLCITVIFKLMTLIPLRGTIVSIIEVFVKFSLALASISVWLRARKVIQHTKSSLLERQRFVFQRTVNAIVYAVICLCLIAPLYKVMLIKHHALLPAKIRSRDWLSLDELFVRVVPATILTSPWTSLLSNSSSLTPLVIAGILGFWSCSQSSGKSPA